ncbi:MAG: MFS transporter, partial [Deltaproteobacteria bacterium]|nr:MFS transporter [Deltaproteobacteria bacterium]
MKAKQLPLPTLGALLLLGVASGVPLDLGRGTLQSWAADAAPNLDLKAIGAFSLIGLPYVLKPLWSPLLDRFTPPGLGHLGRRRGWMLLAQVGCVLALVAMALSPPADDATRLGLFAFMLAFFSASQDIVVDAWRTDVLPAAARGVGAAMASWGYRLGMLLAGFATPLLAVRAGLGWETAYLIMAAVMALGPLATLVAPREPADTQAPRTLVSAVVDPLRDLLMRPGRTLSMSLAMLALVITYKLGDAFASSLFTAFLQRGLGFAPDEVAALRKTIGVIAVLGGMMLGGLLMVRLR